jgi:hypothetical protein
VLDQLPRVSRGLKRPIIMVLEHLIEKAPWETGGTKLTAEAYFLNIVSLPVLSS